MFTTLEQVIDRNNLVESENKELYLKIETLLKQTTTLQAQQADLVIKCRQKLQKQKEIIRSLRAENIEKETLINKLKSHVSDMIEPNQANETHQERINDLNLKHRNDSTYLHNEKIQSANKDDENEKNISMANNELSQNHQEQEVEQDCTNHEIDDNTQKIDFYQKTISELNQKIKTLQDSFEKSIQEKDDTISNLETQIFQLKSQLSTSKEEQEKLSQQFTQHSDDDKTILEQKNELLILFHSIPKLIHTEEIDDIYQFLEEDQDESEFLSMQFADQKEMIQKTINKIHAQFEENQKLKSEIVLATNALNEQKARYTALDSQFQSYKEMHSALSLEQEELSRSIDDLRSSLLSTFKESQKSKDNSKENDR